MKKRLAADGIALGGVGLLIAAGWTLHPAAGLGIAGIVCCLVAVTMVRER